MNLTQERIAEGILFTDQYQLTMAQMYYKLGQADKTVQFDHYFRKYPDYGKHQAGYCIAAGLDSLIDWMGSARFYLEDIDILASQRNRFGAPIFEEGFLNWLLENGNFDKINLRAIPEGRVVHPNIPLTTVEGPLVMAQILESALLNHLDSRTLIARRGARIRDSAESRMTMEFGMRRGQGKGANAGTRAALIGGCDYSSNVGMSHMLGFQPKGTHAHSMIQYFKALGQSELETFQAFADLYPDDCSLLVDTYNTLESGVPNAIKVFENLRKKGHEPVGIRIDSGDLAYLSIQSALLLNRAGFEKTSIVLSNDLDELVIWQIQTQIQQEAGQYGIHPRDVLGRLVYGVGTNLITSEGSPALGGVYKLVAVKNEAENNWTPAIKISEMPLKTPAPGKKQAWRIYDQRGVATADLLGLEGENPAGAETVKTFHPTDVTKTNVLHKSQISKIEPLLIDVLKDGQRVDGSPTIPQMREKRVYDTTRLDTGVKRLLNPHVYHVSLTEDLYNLKQKLINENRNQ